MLSIHKPGLLRQASQGYREGWVRLRSRLSESLTEIPDDTIAHSDYALIGNKRIYIEAEALSARGRSIKLQRAGGAS